MNKIAKSVSEGIELVESMFKGGTYINGEWYEENGKNAYLDWGLIDNTYLNISCKSFADEVAKHFQDKGYFVYYQLMGWTKSGRIAEGTEVAIRIQTYPKHPNSNMRTFDN